MMGKVERWLDEAWDSLAFRFALGMAAYTCAVLVVGGFVGAVIALKLFGGV